MKTALRPWKRAVANLLGGCQMELLPTTSAGRPKRPCLLAFPPPRVFGCLVWLGVALPWLLFQVTGGDVSVTNRMNITGLEIQDLAVNVGDRVTWVLAGNYGGDFTENLGNVWKSPLLTNFGDSFSITLTNTGFYAYRTAHALGTVTARPWTKAPPAISLNTPLDGYLFPSDLPPVLILATATNQMGITRVEFYANSNLIGLATAPPYSAFWTNQSAGNYTLVAKAIGNNQVVVASPPVRVIVGKDNLIWGQRVLPGGRFFFFYNPNWFITTVVASRPALGAGLATVVGGSRAVRGASIVVDEQTGPSRQSMAFYALYHEVAP